MRYGILNILNMHTQYYPRWWIQEKKQEVFFNYHIKLNDFKTEENVDYFTG